MRSGLRIALASATLFGLSVAAALIVLGSPVSPTSRVTSTPHPLSDGDGSRTTDFSSQDRAVLAAVLAHTCARSDGIGVLSSDPADPSPAVAPKQGEFSQAYESMLRRGPNYFGQSEPRSGQRIELPPHCPGLILASHAEIASALEGSMRGPTFADWGTFSSRFPGASSVHYVSLPGYSTDGAHAVVYTSGTCGHLCGSGFSVLLTRKASGWAVTASLSAWIS